MTGADDWTCSTHGWRSHVFVHEAAHAVAAIDHGIPFAAIEIPAMNEWVIEEQHGGIVGGGVRFELSPSELVGRDPDAALAVLSAGVAAEDVALQHHLPKSYIGDLRVWAQGAASTGLNVETIDHRFQEAMTARRERVERSWPRIRAVVVAIAGEDPVGPVVVTDVGPWALSYDAVLAVLQR